MNRSSPGLEVGREVACRPGSEKRTDKFHFIGPFSISVSTCGISPLRHLRFGKTQQSVGSYVCLKKDLGGPGFPPPVAACHSVQSLLPA